ncbi:MAG: hypothetical protein HY299_20715 [Verrucomicrobia bacterium]|nr:hypothetical protein [Verrucomicrobiota bacterium]
MQHHPRMLARPAFWLAALFSVGIFVGCDDARKVIVTTMSNTTAERNAKVDHRLQSALETSTNAQVLVWQEFLTKWPLARKGHGFAWYEDLNKFQGNVSAVTVIEARYAFKVILDFEIDSDFKEIKFPKLRFHFAEVKQVIVPPGGAAQGGVTVLFQPDQKWLGLKEWRQLVESGWNFSVVGVNVISNAPVQNIQSALPNL